MSERNFLRKSLLVGVLGISAISCAENQQPDVTITPIVRPVLTPNPTPQLKETIPQIPEVKIPPDKVIKVNVKQNSTTDIGVNELRIYQDSKTGLTFLGMKASNSAILLTKTEREQLLLEEPVFGFVPYDENFNVEESINKFEKPNSDATLSLEQAYSTASKMWDGEFYGTSFSYTLTPQLNQELMYVFGPNLTFVWQGPDLVISEAGILKMKFKFVEKPPQT
ncbi:MAG: hypothetical protein NUV69_03295 [Candidatus Curtissbacteria bacterium]|nr:hypothetical protein [Candidatus Curtissbacteria bacterium]